MITTLIIGLLIPLLGTMLGSAFVFFMHDEMSARLQKSLLGFASGVMIAASVCNKICYEEGFIVFRPDACNGCSG